MKDTRGINSAAVRIAISREFKIQLPSISRQKSASDLPEWKNSKRIRDCYKKLFDEDCNAIENIAKNAFNNVSDDDEIFLSIYAYTAAICDIVLNPDYPDTECSKKPLQRRFQVFKVIFIFFNNYLFINYRYIINYRH
jgi:hypothetical protein